MLVIIDMQNQVLDPATKAFVPGAEALIPKIAKRLQEARENEEYVLHTRDIPYEYKDTEKEAQFGLQFIPELAPLEGEKVYKKYYFSLPPEFLLEIKEDLFESKTEQKSIEVTGVETNICVLSNTIELQSAFPEADFRIQSALVAGKKHESAALALLKEFNIEIIENRPNKKHQHPL